MVSKGLILKAILHPVVEYEKCTEIPSITKKRLQTQ